MKKTNISPPRSAEWMMKRIFSDEGHFTTICDLNEVYVNLAENKGILYAWFWYWIQVCIAVPNRLGNKLFWRFTMFKNYLKIALRNMLRIKGYMSIYIIGLSAALAVTMLIYLHISEDVSFDRFHKKAGRIQSVLFTDHFFDFTIREVPPPMGPAMKEYFQEIEEAVRIYKRSSAVVRYGDYLSRQRLFFVDDTFFDVFSFPLKYGAPEAVLSGDNSVVLSESMGRSIFGEEFPIGKNLLLTFGNRKKEFTVTGITEDPPNNSTIQYGILLNIKNLDFAVRSNFLSTWRWPDTDLYLLLKTGTLPETIEEKLPEFTKKYLGYIDNRRRQMGRWKNQEQSISCSLQNIKDMHLNSPGIRNTPQSTDKKNSYNLGGIALLVLLVASINFVTISLGRFSARAREIGIRKVSGATRTNMIQQFWIESILIYFISSVLAVFVAVLLVPEYNEISGINLRIENFFTLKSMAAFFLLMFTSGLISGGFPAFLMSAYKPVDIFKDKIKSGNRNLLTKSLIVVQFSLGVILIISTFVMNSHLKYINNKDLGFDKKNVVIINIQEDNPKDSRDVLRLFSDKTKNKTNVRNISASYSTVTRGLQFGAVEAEGKRIDIYFNQVYYDYIRTLGLSLEEGRDFSRDFPSDTSSIVVNQKLVGMLKIDSPIGKKIEIPNLGQYTIIGVVKDFNFKSLQSEIEPRALLFNNTRPMNDILVNVDMENLTGTIEFLSNTWKSIQPDKPFIYSFLDENIESIYNHEKQWNSTVRYSSIISVLITCMGLIGLTAIIINRRVKEIGIRKVLGASISQIVGIILKEFLHLVIYANILAWPFVYFFMKKWLNNYAYKENIHLDHFIFTGILTVIITVLTISCQSIKAAKTRPVETLRYE